jgi:CO/xanthine dehydrogenase Mo-binding subunit
MPSMYATNARTFALTRRPVAKTAHRPIDGSLVGKFNPEASLLGAKGLGELTAVSVAPAIVNADCHAAGKRSRDLPVTVEALL